MAASNDTKEGTALAVFSDLIGYQVDLRGNAGREWALSIVCTHLAKATEALIQDSGDCELQNEGQWLVDAYRWLTDECLTETSVRPDDRLVAAVRQVLSEVPPTCAVGDGPVISWSSLDTLRQAVEALHA